MYFQSSEQIKYYDLRIYARALVVADGWIWVHRATGLLLDFLIFSPAFTCVFVFFFFESVCLPSR
jgi:hypothetical protein